MSNVDMKHIKTYETFSGFRPKKIAGREKKEQEIHQKKLESYKELLKIAFEDLNIELKIVKVQDVRNFSDGKFIYIEANRHYVGSSKIEEYLEITIEDLEVPAQIKTKIFFWLNFYQNGKILNKRLELAEYHFSENGELLNVKK